MYKEIDPQTTPLPQLHQYLLGSIGPRPICFASTVDALGRDNLAPFSFFNVVSANPPIVVFSPNNSGRDGTPKQTYLNAKETGEVVINVVSESIVQQMNVAAAPWEHGVSEFEKAGFTGLASDLVKPLRVAESPVQMECKVLEIKEFGTGGGSGKLVIAQVLKMHINEEILDETGKIDPFKIKLVGRMGGSWYCRTDEAATFQLAQPMGVTIGYDGLPASIKYSDVLSANDLGALSSLPTYPEEFFVQQIKRSTVVDYSDRQAVELLAKEWISVGKTAEALALLMD